MPRRTPPSSSLPPELVAALAAMNPDELTATTGGALRLGGLPPGWRTLGEDGVNRWAPAHAAHQVSAVLASVGAYGDLGSRLYRSGPRTPTAGAQALARVALLAARR